jgi:asparagine synthase (glutamine-hydrolysing)
MCGLAGFLGWSQDNAALTSQVRLMIDSIKYRGPDDSGIWVDQSYGVALGHRRLSILELSPAGHQPMTSSSGRFCIVFNGEIYNHLDLREAIEKSGQLPISGWRGHSDTETLLACFDAWGIVKTIKSTVGMFALAVWDREECALTIARDRIGEKPIYYGWQQGTFLFGSELKSLKKNSAFSAQINWHAVSTFLHLNYIPAPYSIYNNIFKLVPGNYLRITQENIKKKSLPNPVKYWSLSAAALSGLDNSYSGAFEDAVDELEMLVQRAVKMQSIADVPVGAFLSGGIDSSTVVSMLQSAKHSNVTTFSIGMPDSRMDESQHAAEVAKYLGTNHIEHIIQPDEALALIPRLSEIWDEPFADSSQIPTYLVGKLAKQHVTVALSGDGGDEFFLGYPQYDFYQKISHSRFLGKLPWSLAFRTLMPFKNNQNITKLLRRSNSLVNAWRQPNAQALNRYWFDRYRHGQVPIMEQEGVGVPDFPLLDDAASSAALWDAGVYLPDDVLVKVDRASMANSLETRAPLLDHRVIEFSYRLPLKYKLDHGVNKKVLREVLYRKVPKSIVDRPKMGFDIPLSGWLKKELRPWVEDTLAVMKHHPENFDCKAVYKLWSDHLLGRFDHTDQLWAILMLLVFLSQET